MEIRITTSQINRFEMDGATIGSGATVAYNAYEVNNPATIDVLVGFQLQSVRHTGIDSRHSNTAMGAFLGISSFGDSVRPDFKVPRQIDIEDEEYGKKNKTRVKHWLHKVTD